jgi:hypothetical protein
MFNNFNLISYGAYVVIIFGFYVVQIYGPGNTIFLVVFHKIWRLTSDT